MKTELKKFQRLTEGSKNILLVTPPKPNLDIVASTLALFKFLTKKKINTTILDNNFKKISSNKLSFLQEPSEENFLNNLTGSRDFLIIFNTKYNKIIDVTAEQKKDETIIRITPEKGIIDPRDFSFAPANFKYDLIIIIGAPTLEHLGKTYQENTDLFFEVPKININNDGENDNYGQVNIVDLTATSVSEILSEILLEKYPKFIDPNIAQMLLTGIISSTNSFQTPKTTPHTLTLAAQLIKAEANQQEIIKHLYKTKPLSFLKLWGYTMAQLNWDNNKKFIWSLINPEDFQKSRADESDIPNILMELKKNYHRGRIFGVFYHQTDKDEDERKIYGEFIFNSSKLSEKIAEEYNIEPTNSHLKIEFPENTLLKAEKNFFTALNKNL